MKVRTQIIVFVVIVALGVGGYFGWSTYSNRYQVKAFSFDLDDIVNDAFYAAYKAYMSWVNDGVSGGDDNKLKTALKSKLQVFYVKDLDDVKYAYTSRFDNLGMTDCSRIYFGNKDIVNKLKAGSDLSKNQLYWLSHELAHTEQCQLWGGRKNYAIRWFKQVKSVVLNSIKNGSFKDIVKDIFNAQSLAKYDNNMSMEVYADKKAAGVVKKLMP